MSTVLNDGFRVFSGEDIKLVRATAALWDLGLRGVQVAPPVTFERGSVPVYEGEKIAGRQIGSASLFMRGDFVMAFITFDYSTPERLDLEVAIPVYAIPFGSYYLRGDDLKMDYADVEWIELHGEAFDPMNGIGGPLEIFKVEGSSA